MMKTSCTTYDIVVAIQLFFLIQEDILREMHIRILTMLRVLAVVTATAGPCWWYPWTLERYALILGFLRVATINYIDFRMIMIVIMILCGQPCFNPCEFVSLCILHAQKKTDWWFATCFILPYIGNSHFMPSYLTNILQSGWNHQTGCHISSICFLSDIPWAEVGNAGAKALAEVAAPQDFLGDQEQKIDVTFR